MLLRMTWLDLLMMAVIDLLMAMLTSLLIKAGIYLWVVTLTLTLEVKLLL